MSRVEDEVTIQAPGVRAGAPAAADGDDHTPPEVRAALTLARRYRLPYVDLLPPVGESPIDYQLLAEVPVDLMVRHQFVPLRREGRRLLRAAAHPVRCAGSWPMSGGAATPRPPRR